MRYYLLAGALLVSACSSEYEESAEDFGPELSEPVDQVEPIGLPPQDEGGLSGYDAARQAAQDYYSEFDTDFFPIFEDYGPPVIDVAACELSEEFNDEAYVAMFAEGLARRLGALGYPREVYEPAIARFEQQTAPVADDFEAITANQMELARILEAERMRVAPSLPAVVYEGGCGAFEVPVVFASATPNARVYVMQAFDFLECRANVGPRRVYGLETCRWVEAPSEQPLYYSGRVAFQVRAPGRDTQTGYRSIQGEDNFDFDGAPVRIGVP